MMKRRCLIKVLSERTMQWRRSCSSGNCQQWQNRNQIRHIGSRRLVEKQLDHRSSRLARRPYRRWQASISRRSWTLCTYVPSSISSPWMSSCTHLSPTFQLSPKVGISLSYRTNIIRLVKLILVNIKIQERKQLKRYHLESHSHGCCLVDIEVKVWSEFLSMWQLVFYKHWVVENAIIVSFILQLCHTRSKARIAVLSLSMTKLPSI